MSKRERLAELLARVEYATEPDEELDAMIYAEFDDRSVRYADGMMLAKSRRKPHDECVLGFVDPGKKRRNFSWNGAFLGGLLGSVKPRPNVTASIDAALALVAKALPDTRFSLSRETVTGRPSYYVAAVNGAVTDIEAATPALAILAAMFRALIAQTETVAA
jgi:hypothetical protein